MAAPEIAVRPAGAADAGELAVVLARAFHDDPVYAYAFPDETHRAAMLPGFMRALIVTMYGAMGPTDVAVVDGHVVGAGVWADPGRIEPSPWASLRAFPGMLRATGLAGFGAAGRLTRLDAALQARRPAEPHRYLFHLGTDPGWWGHGVGSALLRERLATADAQDLPAYLECKPDNVGYYRRVGFEVTERVPFAPIELCGMLRPPA